MTGIGAPEAVELAATRLHHAAGEVHGAHALVKQARPDQWRGEAADAFARAATKTLPDVLAVEDALRSASGTLTRYAAVQRQSRSSYDTAQADFDRAARALRSNPFDAAAVVNLAQARVAAFGAMGSLQRAAAVAADELRAASGDDPEGYPWWDPFGWFHDKEDPHERVSDNIMDDDSFDPDDVSQGQIGDCFMLSSVVSLLNTDAGDDFIRENIRWDSEGEGYWVTLYQNGEPKEVFVEHVFGHGARQSDWQWLFLSGDKPSIAALYESALRQEYGYDFIDGGIPENAMEKITGKPVDVIRNDDYSGLNANQVGELREVLDDGGQVVISSPRTGEHDITVTAPDGSTREIDIVNTHSYSVMKIEPNGDVWMRNPWGNGNSADGGGEFLVSADDVAALFWRATYTNVTQ